MATRFRLLDGAEDYPRWKESMVLRLHTVSVAYVLSEDPPAGDVGTRAAKKRARDDAVCRGHILAALSDRLFPDYSRHPTAREVWQAVARTYDLDMRGVARRRFLNFEFDHGAPLLEQIAHAEALAAEADCQLFDDGFVAHTLRNKLPANVAAPAMVSPEDSMNTIWDIARIVERLRIEQESEEDDDADGSRDGSFFNRPSRPKQEDTRQRECWRCGWPGHTARNCTA